MRSVLIWIIILLPCLSICQSTTGDSPEAAELPTKFFDRLGSKARSLDQQISRKTQRYLDRLAKSENRLRQELGRIDPSSSSLFTYSGQQYAALKSKISGDPGSLNAVVQGPYLDHADSLRVSLQYLQRMSPGIGKDRIDAVASEWQQVQSKYANADQIRQFISERKQQISQYLSHMTNLPSGITKEYQAMNANLYYYSQQLSEYRNILNHEDQLERKALDVLNKFPAFRDFMTKNSQLAMLFGGASTGTPQAIAGLQTKDAIQALIQQQVGSAGQQTQGAMSSQMNAAGLGLSAVQDRVSRLGAAGKDIDDPNFKPNDQRTKSFWRRLEYGLNVQTQRSTSYFPTTTDLGVSLGYKLNDNNTIGIGASGRIGWGKDIQHVHISGAGLGLRSFADIHLKKTFYLSGGFEYNYYPEFSRLSQVPGLRSWQQSGLVGLSKIISVKSRVFSKTKLQLLWDFLSYEQTPRSAPVKFRIGYAL